MLQPDAEKKFSAPPPILLNRIALTIFRALYANWDGYGMSSEKKNNYMYQKVAYNNKNKSAGLRFIKALPSLRPYMLKKFPGMVGSKSLSQN